MAPRAWVVSDELWELVEPPLPSRERRFRYPGRRRLPDRQCLQGILYVLHTGIPWHDLPPELGLGSGVTCWRRLEEWQRAGVWERLHRLLLNKLRAADAIDFQPGDPRRLPPPASPARHPAPDRPAARPPTARAWGACAGRSSAASWVHQFRRLLVRFERRADMHEAFLVLGCCLICLRKPQGSF